MIFFSEQLFIFISRIEPVTIRLPHHLTSLLILKTPFTQKVFCLFLLLPISFTFVHRLVPRKVVVMFLYWSWRCLFTGGLDLVHP